MNMGVYESVCVSMSVCAHVSDIIDYRSGFGLCFYVIYILIVDVKILFWFIYFQSF